MKVLITTTPFSDKDKKPIELLENSDIEYSLNPFSRKLTEPELIELISDFDAVIAGTEPITSGVIAAATKLKLIARVGVGLDSVDLHAAKNRGVAVTYTPEAPAPAVAELTIGLMLSLIRSIHLADRSLRDGRWERMFGRRLADCTVGIIGVGRIGSRVVKHLVGLGCNNILINDTDRRRNIRDHNAEKWVEKEEIYREADVISLHVPLSHITKNMIGREELKKMKTDAILVNTSRGGVVNEDDLYLALDSGELAGVGLDVFEREPYIGPLTRIDRCILTAHMGSMSRDCRYRMEREATEEIVRLNSGSHLRHLVPDSEFLNQL